MARVIRCGVALGQCKNEYDYPLPDNWDQLTNEEREDILDDYEKIHVWNTINSWAKVGKE